MRLGIWPRRGAQQSTDVRRARRVWVKAFESRRALQAGARARQARRRPAFRPNSETRRHAAFGGRDRFDSTNSLCLSAEVMMRRFRHTRASYAFAALYALAIVLLGFAHQPIRANADIRADLAAYALPDGSLPPICGDVGAPGPGQGAAVAHCDACALSAAPGLLLPPATPTFAPAMRTVALAGDDQDQYRPPVRHAPTSRGPPIS